MALRATVVAEIKAIMDAEEAPLTDEERQRLVQEIARDVMGLGPIEPFLDDATVTEVMVNGTNYIYVERGGVIEQTQRPVHLRRAPASGHRPHRRPGRAARSTSRRPWWTLVCSTALA